MKNFTTSLPIPMLLNIEMVAKELKIPKNQVLMEAFKKWNHARKQMELARSYNKASSNAEFQKLLGMGMEEWESQNRSLEK